MPRLPWERRQDGGGSAESESSNGRRSRRGRRIDPHMELTTTLPLHSRPGDPTPTYTRLHSPQSATNTSNPIMRKLVPTSWGGSGVSLAERTNSTSASASQSPHSRPSPTSQWTLSESNLRITAKETPSRKVKKRASWESDRGGIKCLVVDNDLSAFATSEGEFDWTNSEKSEVIDRTDAASVARSHSHFSERGGSSLRQYAWFRALSDHVWPFAKSFVLMTFPDKEQERVYQREQWHASKPGAFAATLFILLSTFLSIGSVPPGRWDLWAYYAYIGIAGGFTFPIVFFVFFDLYYKAYWLYQLWLAGAAWNWGFLLAIEMNRCGFFNVVGGNKCGTKTYLNLMALLAGIPTLALIAMRQNRLVHLIAQTSWTIFMICLFMNQPLAKNNMGLWRNVILCTVYHYIFSGVAYFRERSDRQLFSLRNQLKEQYRAVQKAQEMERQAEHSKKRFVSYIFHEVRVPLNTARLALANLDAEGAFSRMKYDQRDLLVGLDGSLRMMEKVLNDVLSFNRMESGNLVLTRKPFSIHQAMHHVALAHRATAESAGLSFTVETDPRIDAIGGIFIGDDMRLKQVCSNLISNAFKFTQSGGVRVISKLVYPALPEIPVFMEDDEKRLPAEPEDAYSPTRKHGPLPPPRVPKVRVVDKVHASVNFAGQAPSPTTPATPLFPLSEPSTPSNPHHQGPPTKAVIRIEIHDTGVGLSLSDVRDNRLFSPYVQTELGRRQGGKGSGLGLALVTQIVRLCKGRLGVDSEPKKGSVFWFEIPFTLPTSDTDLAHFIPRESPSILRAQATLPHFAADEKNAGLPVGPRSPPPPRRAPPRDRDPKSAPKSDAKSTKSSAGPCGDDLPPATASSDGHSIRADDSPTMGDMEMARYPYPYPKPSPRSSAAPLPPNVLPASPPLSPTEHHALSTLVVDDDELTRNLMSRMLIRLGHAVQVAEDGQQALEILQRSFDMGPPIDVVFLDNQMPNMSGVEVARALRAYPSNIYIVGCTGNALREDQDEYLAAGADVIITKPIHQSAVMEKLKHARERAWLTSLG